MTGFTKMRQIKGERSIKIPKTHGHNKQDPQAMIWFNVTLKDHNKVLLFP